MEDYVANRRSKVGGVVVSTVASLDLGLSEMIVLCRFTLDERSGNRSIECLVFDGPEGGIIGSAG